MEGNIVNLILGFLEGFALIISPCILPILPIVLAGSLTGSKKRPVGIVIGFIFIFSVFTFFSRELVQLIDIDLNLLRHIAYTILFLLGMMMLSTFLTEKFGQLTQSLVRIGSTLPINNPQGGLIGGILFGGLISIIWTPCAGPILAAVIVQTVIQKTTFMSFLILVAFATGTALPMLMIALFRKIMAKLSYFKHHTILFRKTLGAIIVLSISYMIYFEDSFSMLQTISRSNPTILNLQDGLLHPYLAPSISGIDAWINSAPLQLSALKGKVVLIDFWTYSCINCIRTLPYLKYWYTQYHDKGLVIIGVHTPEFDFEKQFGNVKKAVEKNNILYPIALDSHFVTWQNFNNQYWPAQYLINKNGYVVYTHFGEGADDITENNIRYLLGLQQVVIPIINDEEKLVGIEAETPETYLGYARAEHFSSEQTVGKNKTFYYTFPKKLKLNDWALQGKWRILSDRIISGEKNSSIEIHFHARKVFIVMGSVTDQAMNVKLLLSGKNIVNEKGKDVLNSSVNVIHHTLYDIISLDRPNSGILQVIASSPGLELYTFTFGE